MNNCCGSSPKPASSVKEAAAATCVNPGIDKVITPVNPSNATFRLVSTVDGSGECLEMELRGQKRWITVLAEKP